MKNKLYKHQIEFLEQNPDKSALVWSCGTGKTRTALEWAKSSHRSSLIIVPKALKANWHREIKKIWKNEDCCMVDVVTKEEFRRDWDGQYLSEDYGNIIVDEVHNGFLTPHFKSQMSKALKKYIRKHKVPRVLLLSATVYTSSPWNIYNLAVLTGHNWNWQKFNNTFFDQVRMGFRMIPIPKKGCEAKLAELTKKIANVVSLNECADIPMQTFETEYFELTKEQENLIKESYDPLPVVRFTQHHEIANGILKGNEFKKDTTEIPSLKNDRIYSLCEENDKIIVVCRYNLQIDFLRKFLSRLKKPIFIIRGDVKDRDTVVRNADASEKAIILIQAACSMGYELSSVRIMIFASLDFSIVNFTQMCGRILRLNNLQKNLYIRLLTGETDKAIAESLDKKEDFNVALYYK